MRPATSLTSLGLAAAEPRLPGQLSGGMAQRVAFAAATAGGAPILLADEPTKGLDRSRRDKVVDLLKRAPETGGALLAITHEAHVARALGGKILMLRDGDLIEEGRTLDVLASPKADFTKALLSADPAKWGKSQPKPRSREVLAATRPNCRAWEKAVDRKLQPCPPRRGKGCNHRSQWRWEKHFTRRLGEYRETFRRQY